MNPDHSYKNAEVIDIQCSRAEMAITKKWKSAFRAIEVFNFRLNKCNG